MCNYEALERWQKAVTAAGPNLVNMAIVSVAVSNTTSLERLAQQYGVTVEQLQEEMAEYQRNNPFD